MRIQIAVAGIIAALWLTPSYAQEVKPPTPSELGLEEKLKQVYNLYRSGEVVTLKEHEVRVGLGSDTHSTNRVCRAFKTRDVHCRPPVQSLTE